MAKKYQSVEELYGSKRVGAAPLIWILTIVLLLISIATLLVGTPLVQQAFAVYAGNYGNSNAGNNPGNNGGEVLPYVTPAPEPTAVPEKEPEKESKQDTEQDTKGDALPVATATPAAPSVTAEPEKAEEPTPLPTALLRPYTSSAPTTEPTATPVAEPTPMLQPAASEVPEGAVPSATSEGEGVETLSDIVTSTEPPVSTEPEASVEPEESIEPEVEPETEPETEETQQEEAPAGDAQMRTFESIPDVVDAVRPAVVGIVNYQNITGYAEPVAAGSGSGFVVTENGYIITNAHVVSGAVKLEVLFEDGTSIEAELVGKDTPSDIALLKIEKEGLTVLPMGNSDYLRQGEYVLAIGNPLDSYQLYGTVTFGIISAMEREINIDGYVNTYLQTDAAINLGNSGGPLVNLKGQVVGMNTAKSVVAGYDENGNAVAAEGIGFALPINKVIDIVNTIIIYGSVERPGIGIQVNTLEEAAARVNGLVPGVYVVSITAGGPGEQAGLQAGDVIVAYNGEAVTDHNVLVSYCQSCSVGDSLNLTVYRNGQYLDVVLVIGNINDFSN